MVLLVIVDRLAHVAHTFGFPYEAWFFELAFSFFFYLFVQFWSVWSDNDNENDLPNDVFAKWDKGVNDSVNILVANSQVLDWNLKLESFARSSLVLIDVALETDHPYIVNDDLKPDKKLGNQKEEDHLIQEFDSCFKYF